jgi:glucosamine 6-phosphate synthetase-like amidotransferase/phosphosugar isomerase protein
MCGIAGALVYGKAPLDLFFHAVTECRSRGEDSFGLVRWSPSRGWKELRRLSCSIEQCIDFFQDGEPGPHYFLHTSRAEPTTEFRPTKTEAEIPPFRDGDVAVAHNGIIANDEWIARRFDIKPSSDIDTAIVPALVQLVGFWRAIRLLRGGSAFGVVDAQSGSLYMARNFLPLTVIWVPGMVVFASESQFFAGIDNPFPPYRVWQMPAFTAIEFCPLGYRDPVCWGDVPDESAEPQWRSFPEF